MFKYFQKNPISLILLLSISITALIFFLPKNSNQINFIKKDFSFLLSDGQQVSLSLEIADTEEKRNIGLMHRKDLEEGLGGMIFIFFEDVQSGFWMKDTFIPLQIAFINQEGIINEIISMEPSPLKDSQGSSPGGSQIDPPIYFPKEKYRYAVEVEEGFFTKNNIKTGDRLLGLQR